MRTTLDLPDDLFRQVKAKAAMDGRTLKELLTEFVLSGLQQPKTAVAPGRRSKLPAIKRRGKRVIPNLTPELQAQVDKEEDIAGFERSFGR